MAWRTGGEVGKTCRVEEAGEGDEGHGESGVIRERERMDKEQEELEMKE